ncbi:MAG: hypothetical protein HQK73_13330 [Desulfamplus sp.]|nr:hypothetical protein [Desulfamplus sp.]MBF0413912.1 hypothetical protein [Desulfamplus sp.]
MILITSVIYPPESAKEVAKRYLTAPKLPEYLKKKGPYICADINNGINSITFYEIENERMAEGLQALGNNMASYIGIAGYKYDIRPYYDLEEGLRVIGM